MRSGYRGAAEAAALRSSAPIDARPSYGIAKPSPVVPTPAPAPPHHCRRRWHRFTRELSVAVVGATNEMDDVCADRCVATATFGNPCECPAAERLPAAGLLFLATMALNKPCALMSENRQTWVRRASMFRHEADGGGVLSGGAVAGCAIRRSVLHVRGNDGNLLPTDLPCAAT